MKYLTLILFFSFTISSAQTNWNDSTFTVHGRLTACNGNPTFRIWIIGTNHVLGVYDHGEEQPEMPDTLKELFSQDLQTRVYGDFTVCPLKKYKKGEMQIIRLISITNLVIKKQ